MLGDPVLGDPVSPHPHGHLPSSDCFFNSSHRNVCDVESGCGFDLHFTNDIEHIFTYLLAICVS